MKTATLYMMNNTVNQKAVVLNAKTMNYVKLHCPDGGLIVKAITYVLDVTCYLELGIMNKQGFKGQGCIRNK